MNARTLLGGIGLVAALTLTACGGGGGEGTGGGTAASGGGAAGGATTLTSTADPSGTLAFQQTALEATANQPITVTFQNPAPVQHSWVLVQPGQEDAVNTAAQAKGGDPTGVPGVIAGSKVLNQNGSETITIPAQAAGTYSYICTVPGHYPAGMKGTLTVK